MGVKYFNIENRWTKLEPGKLALKINDADEKENRNWRKNSRSENWFEKFYSENLLKKLV